VIDAVVLDLLSDDAKPKRQKSQPKGKDKRTGKPAEPMEIPVPKRGAIERVLGRASRCKAT